MRGVKCHIYSFVYKLSKLCLRELITHFSFFLSESMLDVCV